MIRGTLLRHCFSQSVRPAFLIYSNAFPAKFASITRKHSLVECVGAVILSYNCTGIRVPDTCWKLQGSPHRHFATTLQPGISWEVPSRTTLLNKLEIALKGHHLDEAWGIFNDFKTLHGFPKQCLVHKLIIEMSYSSDYRWLCKAHDLVLVILKERSDLLHYDFLIRLALVLARAQMPIPASTVVRVMLEKEKFLPMDMLSTVFLHLVKTPTGACLASDILIEICDCCLRDRGERSSRSSKCLKLQTPNTMIFNLVLDACARFGATLKAQQIIEDMMPWMGVIADAGSIVIMALVHEKNGQRDELKKLKEHVESVPVLLDHHYQQFYDSLLSLYFKFNDIDAAAGLILDLYRRQKSLHCSGGLVRRERELERPCLVQIGSCNLRNGLRMRIKPELLQRDFIVGAGSRSELVLFMHGKLVASHKALSKLINGYGRDRKVSDLSNLLVSIEELGFSAEASLSSDVIDACIQLGWLEIAHDILDDMESAAVPVGTVTYTSLLKAYCKGNQWNEAKVLLKQMRKAGLFINVSDEKVISMFLLEEATINPLDVKTESVRKSSLAELLLQEISEKELTNPLVYEINSSIYFFCKAKMMDDALKTFRKMQEMKLRPSVQTFSHLVNGYSSLHMYREITILWGEIRRRMDDGVLAVDRDLNDCLLWNFIRGGYIERVMEIVRYMNKHGMYTDKWKYRREFLKFHKDLYRNLKASKAKTEAQSNRLVHVRAFRRWVGIE
ncbi:pentatricopeptide repeat-containing protein At4g17616 [Magnolia sinica]|uniref:pentatricopeptide repeat-containing protein At4g17616 n=1 Tax=Magnolia sinica TaxID=86752 RepID=UPI0026587CDB|nr:pentatricopeptide repeat-containing protein At4g17616 [Magnolia sinica]